MYTPPSFKLGSVWIWQNNLIEYQCYITNDVIASSTLGFLTEYWHPNLWPYNKIKMIYFTSEQLFGPTGSLKQFDIAITAASTDASSPCYDQCKYVSAIESRNTCYHHVQIVGPSLAPKKRIEESTKNLNKHWSRRRGRIKRRNVF